jgi:hypothetical protein
MAKLNRFVDGATLSFAATLVLLGCGSNAADGPGVLPAGGTGGNVTTVPGGGGAVSTSPGGASVAPGAGGSDPLPPPGSAGATTVPPSSGGATTVPPGSGGATTVPPGSGGATTVPPGSGGSAGNGNGTANGTANDSWNPQSNLDANGLLIAPAQDQGFQAATPVFALQPGQEQFKCYHLTFPNSGEFDVGDWESQMSKGSHHFILYKTDTDVTRSDTLDSFGCTTSVGSGAWIYSAAVPHTHLAMPDGVAMPLASAQKVQFDMHYINTGTEPLQAHVVLNVNKVKGTNFQRAQSQVSFNALINIPPNGTQTVGGDCTPAANAKYFMMLTHTHRRGVDASITRKLANGQMGEVLVHTTNWDSPENILWENPPYLTFQPGEKFHYQCKYKNDRATTTTVGVSAANNEMCMAITYFFPASSPPACTSDVE